MKPVERLKDYPVQHAGRSRFLHPQLNREVQAQTAVRYLRFLGKVRVDHLELPVVRAGRWVPDVPTHPAHVRGSVLDSDTNRWRKIKDVELPVNPKFKGDGISQGMECEGSILNLKLKD